MSQGIFGIVDFNAVIGDPYALLQTMGAFFLKDQVNKGQISQVANSNYILCMKRISDPSFNQQGKIAIKNELQAISLIHGEITNYRDLLNEILQEEASCNGDLDLAIYLYRRAGPHFARKVNGLFSLVILDQRNSSIILLNDRFGMAHQVYWTTLGGRFYFATHLKSLLALPEIKKETNFEALNLFLKYSYIPSPWTIFKGIRKLPPGHMLTYKNGKTTVESYWEFKPPDGSVSDFQETISAYKDLLRKSILRRLSNNRATGILLSGGLDSSANVALAAQCTEKKILTFAVGFDNPAFDERPYARIVSKHFNTEHHETVITGEEIEDLPKLICYVEEPYFEFGLFLTYQGQSAAREQVDVVIGGEGADQLFGSGGLAGGRPVATHYLLKKYRMLNLGRKAAKILKGSYFYDHDNLAFKFRMLWDRATDLNNWYFYGYDENEVPRLYKNKSLANIPRIFPDYPYTQHSTPHTQYSGSQHFNTERSSFADFYLETQINQDLKHYVNEAIMVKTGRMADMLDLTLRESYLDAEVTDFLVSLDYSLKRSGGLFGNLIGRTKTKFLHRKAMESLLPPEVMNKPKQGGFVPVMIFLKNPELRKSIYQHLLNSEVIKEYFRIDYLDSLFGNYERIQGRKISWPNFYNSKANRILYLLTFDIWYFFYAGNHGIELNPPRLSDYLNKRL